MCSYTYPFEIRSFGDPLQAPSTEGAAVAAVAAAAAAAAAVAVANSGSSDTADSSFTSASIWSSQK
jgi:hypothetical protein